MDRIGIFAAAAALVLLSALHMIDAPTYWIAVPALLFLVGVGRIALVRANGAAADDGELARSPTA